MCKNTFLGTVGVKEKMVSHWVNEGQAYGIMREQVQTPKNRESESFQNMKKRQDHLKHFFEQIPKTESYYCRQRTSKLYLEEDFKSKSEVYNIYKKKCEGDIISCHCQFFPLQKKWIYLISHYLNQEKTSAIFA